MNWEYKIVYFGVDRLLDDEQYEARLHDGVHMLNEMGKQGWELVHFLERPILKEMTKYHAVLKRHRTS